MVFETIKEIKERGIRNILSEQRELISELGVAGLIKTKLEGVKERAKGITEKTKEMIVGRKTIGEYKSETEKEIEEMLKREVKFEEEVKEEEKKGGEVLAGFKGGV